MPTFQLSVRSQPVEPYGFIAVLVNQAGDFVGMGMLIASDRILTCAHVVNLALGRDIDEPEEPAKGAFLTVRFPFRDDTSRRATVLRWHAPAGNNAVNDSCELSLTAPLGPEVRPAQFVHAKRDAAFQAARKTGPGNPLDWVYGTIGAPSDGGLFQVNRNPKGNGGFIIPGYSGGPAISTPNGHVLGMVVRGNQKDEHGHIAPTQTLVNAHALGMAAEEDPAAPNQPIPLQPKTRRFFAGVGIGVALWVLWPFLMYWYCDFTHATRWLMNEMTFTVIHLVVFPCVLGILFATISQAVFRQVHWALRAFVFSALSGTLAYIAYHDFIPRDSLPYETLTTDADFDQEMKMRRGDILPIHPKDIPDRNNKTLSDVWKNANLLSWYKGGTTAFYLQMIGWYICHVLAVLVASLKLLGASPHFSMSFSSELARARSGLLASYAMLILWIPARMYADWYQWGFVPTYEPRTGPLFLSCLAAFLVLLVLLAVLKVSHKIIALVCGAFAAGFSALLWRFPDQIGAYLARTEPADYAGALILFTVIVVVWAYAVVGSQPPDETNRSSSSQISRGSTR
jgi:hypothetical protein